MSRGNAEAFQGDRIVDTCVRLAAASLAGTAVVQMPDTLDWDDLYFLVSAHGLEGLTWAAIPADTRCRIPQPIAEQWRNAADLTLFRQLAYDAEREAILQAFRKAGLSWLPLKGITTATYYPQPGLRSMGDQDIVFGFVERREQSGRLQWTFRGQDEAGHRHWLDKASVAVSGIMQARGYHKTNDWARELSYDNQDLHFEFHRSIVTSAEQASGYYDDAMMSYYGNPWRLAVPDDSCDAGGCDAGHTYAGGFHWRPEDEYVFHVAHMMKHYQSAGFGLRFLADEVMFCRTFGGTFDWEYIDAQLCELGLREFERSVRVLAQTLFDHPADWRGLLDERQHGLLSEIIANGTYGTHRNAIRNKFERNRQAVGQSRGWWQDVRVEVLYGFRRIYPDRAWVEAFYPDWAGSWWKRAILPLYRLARGLARHPKDLLDEIKIIVGMRDDKKGRQ